MSKQRAVGEPGTLHHTVENMLIALARRFTRGLILTEVSLEPNNA
jgi:hypothetical protein